VVEAVTVLSAIGHGACQDPRCTSAKRVTWHMDPADCPHALPAACAACGGRWVEDRGDRVLVHAEDCAYLAAVRVVVQP
jgi:hypothetical protein